MRQRERLLLVCPSARPGIVGGRVTGAGDEMHSTGKDAPGRDIPVSVIASGMAVGTVALMILGVQPVLLGALADAHRITDAELGPLATVEVLAIAAGSAFGPAWMRSGHMRGKAIALSVALAVANMAIYWINRGVMLDVLRGVAGLIEGVLMGATIVVTIEGRHPDRLNAIFLAVSTLPQAVMAFFLPIWIVPRFGVNGGFALLAVLSLLSAGASLFLVESGAADGEAGPAPRTLWSAPAVGWPASITSPRKCPASPSPAVWWCRCWGPWRRRPGDGSCPSAGP